MPFWTVAERVYDLPRNIALLDTNVLVAFANPHDGRHEHTMAALDLGEYTWAVTHASLVEAWNMLVGRERRPDLAYQLMAWVLTPGRAILVGDAIEPVSIAHSYSQRFRIDLVDANLIELADRVSRECEIRPAVQIATYDTGDFLRLFGPSGLSFNVYDMANMSSTSDMSRYVTALPRRHVRKPQLGLAYRD
jgi:predicted nucleic acid-binding protein